MNRESKQAIRSRIVRLYAGAEKVVVPVVPQARYPKGSLKCSEEEILVTTLITKRFVSAVCSDTHWADLYGNKGIGQHQTAVGTTKISMKDVLTVTSRIEDRILECLAYNNGRRMTQSSIADAIKCGRNSVCAGIRRLEEYGAIDVFKGKPRADFSEADLALINVKARVCGGDGFFDWAIEKIKKDEELKLKFLKFCCDNIEE